MRVARFGAVGLAALLLFLATAAQHPCCHHCGGQGCVRKFCRLVCEMKEVKEVCYDCACEDFCTPGPSHKCGTREVCDPCHCGCTRCETVWKPSCGQVRTKTNLIKREVVRQVPEYKCVVELVCHGCGGHCGCVEVIEGRNPPPGIPLIEEHQTPPLPPAPLPDEEPGLRPAVPKSPDYVKPPQKSAQKTSWPWSLWQ